MLARLVHENGELDRAIELQKHALGCIKRNSLVYREFLKSLEGEKEKMELKAGKEE